MVLKLRKNSVFAFLQFTGFITIARDISWHRNVYRHKESRLFCAEIWSLKPAVGRIVTCACLFYLFI